MLRLHPPPSRQSRVASKLRKLASLDPRIYREAVSTRLARHRHHKLQVLRRRKQEQTERADAFRVFETPEGVRRLEEKGWTIANHTAAHFPVGEDRANHLFESQFTECEEVYQSLLGKPSRFWVLPFEQSEANDLFNVFGRCGGNRYLVLVGNRLNHRPDNRRVLYRFAVPECTGDGVVRFLKKTCAV